MSSCATGNGYNGEIGLRVSSIFVMMVTSWAGAWFPVFARRHQRMGVPEWSFFGAKYFGSGVIISTAFIHLLAPANEAWMDPCLQGIIPKYPWAEGIALMTILVLFIVELMTMRYAKFELEDDAMNDQRLESRLPKDPPNLQADRSSLQDYSQERVQGPSGLSEDHFGHVRKHVDNADIKPDWEETGLIPETYSAQLTAVFVLEFGVIFHSVFVGLTLAVAGKEFVTLYIVLVFHQTFEGLGLGSRLATIPWPRSRRWTPYILASAFGITTPIAIAIGLAARRSYEPGSKTALIANGIFDSISAGVLIYTALIELMAHEFMFSTEMRKAPLKTVLAALGLMVAGAGIMAVLGYWT